MLAKNYHFAYDTIKSLITVQGNRKKMGLYTICMQEVEYPIYNMELVVEQVNVMKKKISDELDRRPEDTKDEKDKVEDIMRKVMTASIKEIKMKIIVDSGYKESFYYDREEGAFSFDLGSIKRVGAIGSHTYKLSEFLYKGQKFDLSKVSPELWRGKWSIVKNSL